jgi:hypothetical protein
VIEQLFDNVFEQYGHRWQPGRGIDQYDDEYTGMLLDFVRRSVNGQKKVYGPKGPIFCDFVINPSFNALATAERDHELIALFTGALSHLVAAHHCLLSDPVSLPMVGDPKNEKLSQDALELFKSGRPLQEPHHHPNGERFQVAACLTWLSCAFIALHEGGHIIRCHPAYLQHKWGFQVYEELPMLNINQNQIDIRLAFEWEADEYAAITSYQLAHQLIQSGAFEPLRPLGLDFSWGLAISMVLLIIARLSKSWAAGSRTHPPAFMRYVWSMMSVEQAPECVSLGPHSDSLRAGFSEALGWFLRNKIEVVPEIERSRSSEDLMEEMQEQHSQVRAILVKESELLRTLADYRAEKADRWLRNEKK